MGEVTVSFKSSNAAVPGGICTKTLRVPDDYDEAFIAALMSHPSHGTVSFEVMDDTGQKDENGESILGLAHRNREATFEEAVGKWADANVFNPLVAAIEDGMYQASLAAKVAEVARPVIPVTKE
jgi:hypothetical protein